MRRPCLGPCAFAALLVLLFPRAGRAESTLGYKFQNYQEDGDRIRVRSHYARADVEIDADTRVRVLGLIDAISGATPTGELPAAGSDRVPLAAIEDERRAGQVEISRRLFGRHELTLQYAHSREHDYLSRSASVGTLSEFFKKATSVRVGFAYADDEVGEGVLPAPRGKLSRDLIAGLTQILGERTTLTANLSYGKADGYLSDPYKLILKNVEILPGLSLPALYPENRPEEREKWIGFVSLSRFFKRADGSLETSWRHFQDDFGISADTVTAEWYQRLGSKAVLRPLLRGYSQSSADFYRPTLDGLAFTPGSRPNGIAPFYSADYRLSKFEAITWGGKFVFFPRDRWTFDVSMERYEVRGLDETPGQSYADATVVTLGGTFTW